MEMYVTCMSNVRHIVLCGVYWNWASVVTQMIHTSCKIVHVKKKKEKAVVDL